MGEGKRCAFLCVRSNFCGVQITLTFVRGQDHDDVSVFHRLSNWLHCESSVFRLHRATGAVAQTHDHIFHTRIAQVIGMCMALRAIAHDHDLHPLDDGKVGVFFVVNLHAVPLSCNKEN